MVSHSIIAAIDFLLRDTMSVQNQALESIPFGGKMIIFGGDFRQTLPITPGTEPFSCCFLNHQLWPLFQRASLTDNMRVQRLSQNQTPQRRRQLSDFADFVLRVGNNTLPINPEGLIELPRQILSPSTSHDEFVGEIYGRLFRDQDNDAVANACILAPRNRTVDELNSLALQLFTGNQYDLHAFDRPDVIRDVDLGSVADITVDKADLPPLILSLKVGCPVILIRNISPSDGLSNGSKLIVDMINTQFLRCHKPGTLQSVTIPLFDLRYAESKKAQFMRRRQFPVKIAFAMTINKSQGQTLSRVGVSLELGCFAHGQLYVALSRVGDPQQLRIYIQPEHQGRTINVVNVNVGRRLLPNEP
jgi:ATP-dependent DNA helicase PIF1